MGFMHKGDTYTTHSDVTRDEGLRKYLIGIYNYMAAALGVTGLVAFGVASSDTLISAIFHSPLAYLVMFAPLVFAFIFYAKIETMRFQTAQGCFWAFAVMMGLSMSSVFLMYRLDSIARVFFITASLFGLMAAYGNTTNKDLTSMGSFLIMGVLGMVIAAVVNIFLQSSGLHFAISAIGVIVFTGLTAYDAQRIKHMYYHFSNTGELESGMSGKMAILGALSLYLNFINLFTSLLQLMGDRK